MQITQKSYKSGTDMLYTLSVGYRKGLEFSNTGSIERSVDEILCRCEKKGRFTLQIVCFKGNKIWPSEAFPERNGNRHY